MVEIADKKRERDKELNLLPLPQLQALIRDLIAHIEELHLQIEELEERVEALEDSEVSDDDENGD